MRNVYQTLRLYSVVLGCNILRVSMCDSRGGEFFVTLRDEGGPKIMRQQKEKALEAIVEAMEVPNAQPGEVFL